MLSSSMVVYLWLLMAVCVLGGLFMEGSYIQQLSDINKKPNIKVAQFFVSVVSVVTTIAGVYSAPFWGSLKAFEWQVLPVIMIFITNAVVIGRLVAVGSWIFTTMYKYTSGIYQRSLPETSILCGAILIISILLIYICFDSYFFTLQNFSEKNLLLVVFGLVSVLIYFAISLIRYEYLQYSLADKNIHMIGFLVPELKTLMKVRHDFDINDEEGLKKMKQSYNLYKKQKARIDEFSNMDLK